MKSTNILKHPVFLLLPVVLVIALYLLFGRSSMAKGDWFGAKSAMVQQKTVSATVGPVVPATKAVVKETPPVARAGLNREISNKGREFDEKEKFLLEEYNSSSTVVGIFCPLNPPKPLILHDPVLEKGEML